MQNKDILNNPYLVARSNSIDSLASTNPMFKAIAEAEFPDRLSIHNIVGRLEKKSVFGRAAVEDADAGDGVVSLSSASSSRADSQVFVAAEHSKLHQLPGSIYEVRRLLLAQLAEKERVQPRPVPPLIRSVNRAVPIRQ